MMEPVIVANTKFSIDLLKELCQVYTDNVVFSPLSISSALGLVVLGANGNTEKQMLKTLHFNDEKIMYHDLYEEINKDWKKLTLFNHMFGERTINFNDVFQDKCEKWCSAGLRNVDFKTNPEAAKEEINTLVAEKTDNLVTNLLQGGDVCKDSILALISAVYFKENWHQSFTPLLMEHKYQYPKMMTETNTFLLGKIPEADSRILELPYENQNVSMLIMLPDKSDGLQKLLNMITYEKIVEWTEPDHMISTTVEVVMPIFELKERYDLEVFLKALGITDVFGDNCDLSGMASGKLKMSKVVHGCSVKVDCTGTKAGGGSNTVVKSLKRPKPTESFVADHSFLFFIRHNATKSILFWGRYNPKGAVNQSDQSC